MPAGSQRSSRRPAGNPARASSPARSRCAAQVQAITAPRVSCQRPSAAALQRAAPARTEHRAGGGVRTRRAADRHVAPQYCRRRPPPARDGSGVPQCAHRPPFSATPPVPLFRPSLLNRAKHSTARFSSAGGTRLMRAHHADDRLPKLTRAAPRPGRRGWGPGSNPVAGAKLRLVLRKRRQELEC